MSKRGLGIRSLLAGLLLVFVAGCGEETVTVPSVVSTIPANGATAVAVRHRDQRDFQHDHGSCVHLRHILYDLGARGV